MLLGHARRQTSAIKRCETRGWRQTFGTWLVGEGGHYLNRPGEVRGDVLDLIRAHRDRLESLAQR
jgi:hypothetical protein